MKRKQLIKHKISIYLFAFLLICIILMKAVSIHCFLIKYWTKQKHLLQFLASQITI